jgi:hypothetical protein
VLWRGVHCPSRLGPAEDPPLVTVCSEVPPLGECDCLIITFSHAGQQLLKKKIGLKTQQSFD